MKIIPFYKNEKQLIRKSISGHRDAQQRLYEKYAPIMLSVCRRYVKDLQFAEDVMVTGFVKVFKNLESYRGDGSFEGWVRKIMVRESISYLRKHQFVVFDNCVFEEAALQVDKEDPLDVEYIQHLIDALPEGYRTVFVLYAVEGYKHQDIAQILGIAESTSKSQLSKARKWLQEKLKQQNVIGYADR
ncbi:RNA polymerase sigma factor [Pseudozobellia thermophila]|uniref:RNA polymerase sigma-70 factor, ECF subfamily n=1 Tax=Pseudozobellia thermophila TaxID=192903 RepID=A0A1M6JK54_9FLAO|nr:RNA polymerase sigma factor [Pseudozobellia thermophila]SHJ47056.1 RNA polymerase sigma-70 factor, ECF subfamily [Pseudozobellia thermophila]